MHRTGHLKEYLALIKGNYYFSEAFVNAQIEIQTIIKCNVWCWYVNVYVLDFTLYFYLFFSKLVKTVHR